MAITIKHAKTDNIADWTQADLDAQIALGNYPAGTVLADIVLPSDWNNDHTFTGTLGVSNGGTGVTTSSGANSVVLRDANQNIAVNSVDDAYVNQATGTAITLTAGSARRYTITGSGGQTIKLPDATTLSSGAIFQFDNNQTSGAITVNNNSNTLIVSVPSGGYVLVNLLSNATAAGSWDRHDQAPSNVSWSTNTFDYAGSITSATWNGTAIALNRGGTNANLTAVNGGAVYSTGTALAISAAGTSGQVLTSSGAGAPTWTTPTTGTVTSVTGTSPVVSSGGATPAISMPAATTSVNGYLTSTDWNTFNGKGSGTVTSTSVVSANGFAGTVATATSTPAITLTTTITGVLKGNGTAISAATAGTDYSAGTSALATGILKSTTTTGALSIAVAADFPTLNQNTTGSAATLTTARSIYGSSFNGSADIAGPITGTYGGTGVNNGSNTITIAGNVTHSGAFTQTFTATGNTSVTLPTTGTLATLAGTETLTNKRVTPRVSTTTSSATPTINTDNVDTYGLTAQAADITSFTTNLSGTPTDGQRLHIYIVGTAARAITWGASFENSTVTLPSTTVTTNRLDVGFIWNAATSKWRCVASA
jgi:hypothetical protein